MKAIVDRKGIIHLEKDNERLTIDCKIFMDIASENRDCAEIAMEQCSIIIDMILNGDCVNPISEKLREKVRHNYKDLIFPKTADYLEKLENTQKELQKCS